MSLVLRHNLFKQMAPRHHLASGGSMSREDVASGGSVSTRGRRGLVKPEDVASEEGS